MGDPLITLPASPDARADATPDRPPGSLAQPPAGSAVSETSPSGAAIGEARTEGRPLRRALADPATLLVALALLAGVAYFCLAITSYRNLFVHPDFHQSILKESLHDGLAIGPR